MLLTSTDHIFDELESHQVSLQTMQGSSAAGSFLDEVLKWQKRLQTLEAVLTLWLEVQEKWIQLEEVDLFSFNIRPYHIALSTHFESIQFNSKLNLCMNNLYLIKFCVNQ